MKRTLLAVSLSLIAGLLAMYPASASAQGRFESVAGTAFSNAVPNDFYLEGNRIPVEKRNSVLLKDSGGARVVVGLLDTAGYSAHIKEKYRGFIITESNISFGGSKLGVGSYGIGLDLPGAPTNADGSFKIYNQAGEKVGEGTLKYDANVKLAKPLGVSADKSGPTKLLFGKYVLEIE
jgi:hypothetical protein